MDEPLGTAGDRCRSCGVGLDTDQRYCLNCGTRRAGSRLDFERYLAPPAPEVPLAAGGPAVVPVSAPAEIAPKSDWTPFAAVSILAGLGVILVIGVLIGRGGGGDSGQQVVVPAATATPSTATAAAPTETQAQTENASTGSATTFTSDWPDGKNGFTVEVGTLPKSGTTPDAIAAAMKDVEAKGASGVGALDSDQYPTLPGGTYVIYAGVFTTKAEATKALGELKGDFPDAKVVQVSKTAATPAAQKGPATNSADELVQAGKDDADQPVTASDDALDDLASQTGDEYQETIKNLPDEISTEGAPAQIDTTKPPGGSDPGPTTVIK